MEKGWSGRERGREGEGEDGDGKRSSERQHLLFAK